MNRRDLLKGAAVGPIAFSLGGTRTEAQVYYPVKVNESLFTGINRLENPQNESQLAKVHVPVIKAPEKVNAGDIFPVEVTVGKVLHPMMPVHWIEHLQVNIGNEPGGTMLFRSHGYMKPEGRFNLVLDNDLKGKTVSLVFQIRCNLHGIWESHVDLAVV